eukprot:362209-Chlamydomonas_euryale.AAC.4
MSSSVNPESTWNSVVAAHHHLSNWYCCPEGWLQASVTNFMVVTMILIMLDILLSTGVAVGQWRTAQQPQSTGDSRSGCGSHRHCAVPAAPPLPHPRPPPHRAGDAHVPVLPSRAGGCRTARVRALAAVPSRPDANRVRVVAAGVACLAAKRAARQGRAAVSLAPGGCQPALRPATSSHNGSCSGRGRHPLSAARATAMVALAGIGCELGCLLAGWLLTAAACALR